MSSFALGTTQPVVVFRSGRASHVTSASKTGLTLSQLAQDSVGSSQRVNLARLARQRLAVQFEDSVSDLKSTLDQFSLPEADSLRLAKGVVSSDEDVVSGQATALATLTRHRVRLDMAASAQQNRSINLTPTDSPSLSAGTYTFDLTVGGDTRTVEVRVLHSGYTGQADTNLSLLNKIARQINAAETRIRAEVVQTEVPAYSSLSGGQDMTEQVAYLTITALDVGEDYAFSLSDRSGDLVETYGLSRQSQSGTRSRWKLEGVSQDSPDNDPQIDDGRITLHFKTLHFDYETLTVVQGKTAVLGQVSQVLTDYDELMALLAENRDSVVSGLAENFRREALSRKSDLAEIGLEVTRQGLILVNDRFLTALDTDYDSVQETLTGENGLFNALSSLVDQVDETGVDPYLKSADTEPAYSASALALSLDLVREGYGLISLIV